MLIHGLQKMTLLDYPGYVACTVFLSGCDFRCPYCHNFELVDGSAPPIMDEEDLFSFREKRKGLLDGVAITGGEPCLNKDLPALLKRIREMGFMTKLDTNGNHQEMLKKLLDEELLDYVAMDIKNSPEKYAMTIGKDKIDLAPIRESISLIMGSKIVYEFRTTVVDEFHKISDFEEIGAMIEGAKRYFIQPFTDRDTVPFGNLHAPGKADLEAYLALVRRYVPNAELRGAD